MNKRACDDAITRLYPYLDGEINSFRKWVIRHHLKSCSPCESAFSFEQRLKVVIRERTSEEVPPEVLQRLKAFLQQEEPDLFDQ